MNYIGIDVGGTFTDTVVLSPQGMRYYKAHTTPGDPTEGVLETLQLASEDLKLSVPQILRDSVFFAHGTTVTTNAVIQYKGVKTGLIATKGFGDQILAMRTHGKTAGLSESEILHIMAVDKPKPIVPRRLIREVAERVDSAGAIIAPLNVEEAKRVVKQLVEEDKVEAIAVCLLWSFRNSLHEQTIADLIRTMYPNIFVTISSDIAPHIGEYERSATTAVNSYIAPLLARYVNRLDRRLKESGLEHPLLLMQSSGYLIPATEAPHRAVTTLASGPAGGVVGSLLLSRLMGYQNVVTTDVGGTTFDVALIREGLPEIDAISIVNQYELFAPKLAIKSIGAGGGSVAWLDTGILRVGPQSAGAVPGPACYDAAGTEPTVTDANLILGYINPDNFLGGRQKLNVDKAREAIKTKVADPLGLDVVAAAAGIYEIVNCQMSDLIRKITVERGFDPREFVLFAFGGGGPVHCGSFGVELEIPVVVPLGGVCTAFSAFGIAGCDLGHRFEMTDPMQVPGDLERVNRNFEKLEAEAIGQLERDRVNEGDRVLKRFLSMRFNLQVHEVTIDAPGGKIGPQEMEQLVDSFERKYENLYGKGSAFRGAGMQMITFGVDAVGRREAAPMPKHQLEGANASHALKPKREVYFTKYKGFVPTNIYDGDKLRPGNVVEGPAVLEMPATTVVVLPGQSAAVDQYLNILISTAGVDDHLNTAMSVAK